jgi:exodeoxyribonuclease VII large subunit
MVSAEAMETFSFISPKNVLSVSDLTGYLRQVLESDEILQDLWVAGEISNYSRPASGHLYFTLKDNKAAIKCVMWRNTAARLNFSPREGMAVEAHGGMSVYEAGGQVQLYVDTMRPAGEGALYQEFLRLKALLEAEGLFDPDRKRPIPLRPQTIGIVTSPTGAALQDMLNTLKRRYPVTSVVIAPTQVQGSQAPLGIVAALNQLNSKIHPDVILIGRGGGSIEDLWAFNDESVARAVAASEAPVISGVGHETDFTLTDFAADLRAPTPTAAAELASPDKIELLGSITEIKNRHAARLQEVISDLRWEHNQVQNRLVHLSPEHAINTYRQRLDELSYRFHQTLNTKLDHNTLQLKHLQHTLHSLNPQAVLKRGYAIVTTHKDGKLIRTTQQVQQDDTILIQLSRGSLDARITKINQENENE